MNPYKYQDYFEWLCQIVGADRLGAFAPYKNLLTRLFQTDFQPCRYMDDNREVNGRMLRYYYDSNKYDYALNEQAPYHIDGDFYETTRDEQCSILEMLIAFAKEIDVGYLYSNESRVFVWFWIMIEAMGLSSYVDNYWDERMENNDVDEILRVFNANGYSTDEYGNWIPTVKLFPIRNNESFGRVGSLWEEMLVWYNEQFNYLDDLNPEEFINYYTCTYMYG